jgi:hypothetical protein
MMHARHAQGWRLKKEARRHRGEKIAGTEGSGYWGEENLKEELCGESPAEDDCPAASCVYSVARIPVIIHSKEKFLKKHSMRQDNPPCR